MLTQPTRWLLWCGLGLALACGDSDTGDSDSGETTGAETTGAETTGEETTGDQTDGTTDGGTDDTTVGTDDTTGSDSDASSSDSEGTTGPVGACSDVPCAEQMLLDLSLQAKVSEGAVENSEDGSDWLTTVDATAGGTMGATTNPWVYIRFTSEGAQRVDIDDEAALASLEWHIAAKRYGVRINSGSGGPGCVAAAAFDAGTYDAITDVPDGATWREEAFYDEGCTLVEDGSGLPGSPDYALGSWWGYMGCVTTTGVPFILDLGDEGMVKLVVESYYQTGQEDCNQNGAMGTGSGNLTWRWQYL